MENTTQPNEMVTPENQAPEINPEVMAQDEQNQIIQDEILTEIIEEPQPEEAVETIKAEITVEETPVIEASEPEIVQDEVSIEPIVEIEAEIIVEVTPVIESSEPEKVQDEVVIEPIVEIEAEITVEEIPVIEALEPEISHIEESPEISESPEKAETAIPSELAENHHDDEIEELHEDVHEIDAIELEKEFNTQTREELVTKLEALVQEAEIAKIKTNVALIKVTFLRKNKEEKQAVYNKFIEEGGKKEEYHPEQDELETRFNNAFQVYKEKRKTFLDEQEKIKQENLKKKLQILDEIKELINSEETLKKTYDDFKSLQERWKEIGMIPQSEIADLWQRYHFLSEKFFDKVKINKELKDLDLRKNFEAKMLLCEKVEELLLETSINKSFKDLQRFHEEWKELGPVPSDKSDEIWERFKAASDKINERRREYYKELSDEQKNNHLAKMALCEKAEEILATEHTSINMWQDNTEVINELLKVWKTLGPAPKNVNNEVWERFRTSLTAFFEAKNEYFNSIKEEQINNYNLKLDICVQAEAMQNSTDWKKTTRDILQLQEEWKTIGPVPRKLYDKIWKRFRAACDAYFNAKAEYFSNINQHETENLQKKEELILKVSTYGFTGNRVENLNAIKEFQREFMEIGFVPMKDKMRLQNEFRAAVDKRLDELKISQMEINTMDYKSRIEHLKESPDAKRNLFKEKSNLKDRITEIQSDITLWENNLGFLAKSKNADILKVEFEKKIQKAKDEVRILEAKMKFIQSQG